ncbi:MAG: Oxygen-independent coproporphyrinogen-III oxidase-like protein YqeR [Phycisphaerae bacterium]|nr:Oxygen-independent coproporphyrinogen-III oxidase-like protein YqeR [Phycisphaerae bacterium]
MQPGLYVHIPYCQKKCGYCDFYSVPLGDRSVSSLIRAILHELDHRHQDAPRPFRTIFVGGGTPTILPLDDLRQLFQRLGEIARQDQVAEFSCEANPATVDEQNIALLVQCGVNRLSFGVQSYHQVELDFLDRLHHPDDVPRSVKLARTGGINNINLDLIFGVPGQTLSSWQDTLRRTIDLHPEHISCYGLTYETGTALTARLQLGQIEPMDEDLEADLYLATIELLQAHGYEQYEISNFALPGRQCEHNLIYWSNGPYLGIGPSASSYLGGYRFKNVPHIGTYIGDVENGRRPWREEERLSGSALAGETAMMQLRLNQGIHISSFTKQVGVDPLQLFHEPLERFTRDCWLEISGGYIRLTSSGRLVANRIISELLSCESTPSAVRTSLPLISH